jgi:hypothetical protein
MRYLRNALHLRYWMLKYKVSNIIIKKKKRYIYLQTRTKTNTKKKKKKRNVYKKLVFNYILFNGYNQKMFM